MQKEHHHGVSSTQERQILPGGDALQEGAGLLLFSGMHRCTGSNCTGMDGLGASLKAALSLTL